MSLKTSEEMGKKQKHEYLDDDRVIVSAPVVEYKVGNADVMSGTEKEYYLRMSIQDYYIKLSESQITEEELEKQLESTQGDIKVIKVEIEYKSGDWDEESMQDEFPPRSGAYVVIHRIIS